MVIERAAENNAKEAPAADKREPNKQRKSVLKTLEEKGGNALKSFMNDQLLALLVHANPRENIPKSKNKAEYQERVRALTTIQKALDNQALAIAPAIPPQQAPPPASMAFIIDDFLRKSLGSVF